MAIRRPRLAPYLHPILGATIAKNPQSLTRYEIWHSHPKSGAKALHWMKTTTIFPNMVLNETLPSLQGERGRVGPPSGTGLSVPIASGDIAEGTGQDLTPGRKIPVPLLQLALGAHATG